MSNLKRLLVSTAILINLLLTACGGDGGGTGGGSGSTPSATAVSIALPETGQTTCTDATGVVIACAGTGQDGEHRAGVAWPNPRFSVDNTGNCMTDNLTGLMWARQGALSGTWQAAFELAANLNLCGFTDWRIPNRKELLSLVNYGEVNNGTWLLGNGFTFQIESILWSSSSVAGSADRVWALIVLPGILTQVAKSPGISSLPVRAGR
ncbi:MAG: DUF1566 domain-containing protein [Sulfuricaulis sp.]|uniref:Lcl C-terminal domain-containing protein n=1 Tax=Sulfuricaulis sp. TaxID=2003553 RepID=UPI0025E9F186|nr:DUF1566 domain-containing protein [Sulfuricaulis sp.]MCR4347645.1 DUF1566 domain-containing protein [Sulfuricaulis sp.]